MIGCFRFQGKLRVGTHIFQDPKPHQTRISLSQVENYNQTNYGYVSNSISVDSGSDGDVEDTPTTRIRRKSKKSYQYSGSFGSGMNQFGGERSKNGARVNLSSKQNISRNRKNEKPHRKKLKFNFKKHGNGDGDKRPRKSCKICPTCGHSWNGKYKKEQSDTELSGDEMVCF